MTALAWKRENGPSGAIVLVFDRPGSSQNSLDSSALDELGAHLGSLPSEARALIVRSGKPRGFCAGADLKQFHASPDVAQVEAIGEKGMDVFARLSALPIPTVALIHGVCLGGGLELALACRYRLAIDDPATKLGSPEVKIGLIPGWGAIAALPRRIGLELALGMLLTGEAIGAGHAIEVGLVDRVVPASSVETETASFLASPSTAPLPPWPPEHWTLILDEYRRALEIVDADARIAPLRLLDVLETELRYGPDAGRRAAVEGLAELAVSPRVREAIAAFFRK